MLQEIQVAGRSDPGAIDKIQLLQKRCAGHQLFQVVICDGQFV